MQECQQNSRRLQLLSALLEAIFQPGLFSQSWVSGSAANERYTSAIDELSSLHQVLDTHKRGMVFP